MAATRSRKKAASSVKAGTKAKAPAELERGTARAGSPQPVMGAATGTMSAPFAQQAGGATAAWAFPPSVTALPQAPGGAAFQPGITQAGAVSAGSLSETLGSTLRLGVDVVNAGLVGVLNVLGGLSGVAAELDGPPWSHPGCGSCCGCCDPCVTECGCYDCCCLLGCGGCCQPGVGTC
jgi:hypothetical protein